MPKRVVLLSVVGIVALLLSACVRTDNPAEQRSRTVAKERMAIYIAATSAWSSKRNLLLQGLELAKDQANDQGGVIDRIVNLLYFDDQRSLNTGKQVAYEIVEDEKISAVIGHSASFISIPNSLIYQYHGLLMLSPLSTNRKLTKQQFNLVFRNIPMDDIFAKAAAKYCFDQGWNRILIYYADNDYGQSLANVFEMESRGRGISIMDRVSYDSFSSEIDFQNTARYWKNNYLYDAVFLAGTVPQAANIVKVLRAEGIDSPILGSDALDQPMLLKIAGPAAEGVHAFTIFDADNPYPPYVKFSDAFMARYGYEPDQAALQGYDALQVILAGISAAGTPDPQKVAAALHDLPEWEGAAGPYRFDQDGDVVDKQVFLKVVKDGKYQRIQ